MGPANTGYITDDVSDCAELHSVGRLDAIVCSIVENPIGRLLCVSARFLWEESPLTVPKAPCRERRYETEQSYIDVYGDGWSIVVAQIALVFIVGIFFGIPVALQAMHVTNALGTVICYLVFLLAFIGVARIIFHDLPVVMMATIAFASIFASLVGK